MKDLAGRWLPRSKGTANEREVSLEEGEKSCVYRSWSPYRKPTQVDRKKILRPTGEGLLRNSAS